MHKAPAGPVIRYNGRQHQNGAANDLKILDPALVKIYRPDGGFPNLILGRDVCYPRIRVVCCFPFSDRSIYVSLRDWDNDEIGVVEDPASLDEESRRIIQGELDKRYFLSEITHIQSITNQYGTIIFDVHTNRGRRVFNVRDRHRNIVHLGRGRVLLIDTDGCQYDIPNQRLLSHHSQRQLFKIL